MSFEYAFGCPLDSGFSTIPRCTIALVPQVGPVKTKSIVMSSPKGSNSDLLNMVSAL